MVALPTGVAPGAAVGRPPRGAATSSRADGRFFVVDAYGVAFEVERLAGDVGGMRESPPNALVELTTNEPTALVPDGALVVRDGT